MNRGRRLPHLRIQRDSQAPPLPRERRTVCMMKYALCLLALAACGGSDKPQCDTASDCSDGQACLAGVCQPTDHDACGPSRATCAAAATCTQDTAGAACTCDAGLVGDGITHCTP